MSLTRIILAVAGPLGLVFVSFWAQGLFPIGSWEWLEMAAVVFWFAAVVIFWKRLQRLLKAPPLIAVSSLVGAGIVIGAILADLAASILKDVLTVSNSDIVITYASGGGSVEDRLYVVASNLGDRPGSIGEIVLTLCFPDGCTGKILTFEGKADGTGFLRGGESRQLQIFWPDAARTVPSMVEKHFDSRELKPVLGRIRCGSLRVATIEFDGSRRLHSFSLPSIDCILFLLNSAPEED